MFEGFTTREIETAGTEIHLRTGGAGPPLLLLHGYPQSHVMWHLVAPRLAERFTVVCADLRGYGDSGKPPSDPAHAAYSKRASANDMVEVMAALGHDRFALASSYAHMRTLRLADGPDEVHKLSIARRELRRFEPQLEAVG